MNEPASSKELLTEAVNSFRLGIDGQGSDALVKFIDCLGPFLEANAESMTAEEAKLLGEIIEAQTRQDYIYVADLLEYVLPQSGLGGCLS